MDLNEVKTEIQNHISGIASSIGECAPIARTITGETIESLADLLVDRTTGQDIFNEGTTDSIENADDAFLNILKAGFSIQDALTIIYNTLNGNKIIELTSTPDTPSQRIMGLCDINEGLYQKKQLNTLLKETVTPKTVETDDVLGDDIEREEELSVAGADADPIVAGAGGADPIVAGAGGTDNIVAGAGGADNIVAGAGGADNIVAGAGGADNIVAGAGGADHSVVGAGGADHSVVGAGGADHSVVGAGTNPRETYKKIYITIDACAITAEQARIASIMADEIFNNREEHPSEFELLSKQNKDSIPAIYQLLKDANKQLGHRSSNTKNTDTIPFQGKESQTRVTNPVKAKFVVPEGFGAKKSAVLWNQPVITDFGYPFLNFSSEAMLSVLKSKGDEELKNDRLKKMFKEAKKKYGGIWKAIYAAPLEVIKDIATNTGTKCTPNYLKVDGMSLINSEIGSQITVTPVKYYSVDPAYEEPVTVPRNFISNFYEVLDYTTSSRQTYLKYAVGMDADDFATETTENGGIPPFYILMPKKATYSKSEIRSTGLFGSLLGVILGRKPCTMVKTAFDGKRGCLMIESKDANKLFSET